MSFELTWLIYTILLTCFLWLPYVLNRIAVRGLFPAMGYETAESAPHSAWAERAINAHANAIENLVLFAPLALAAHVMELSTPVTRAAVVVYFFARAGHYVVYLCKIPMLRTLIFIVGYVAVIMLAVAILQAA